MEANKIKSKFIFIKNTGFIISIIHTFHEFTESGGPIRIDDQLQSTYIKIIGFLDSVLDLGTG